MSSAAEDDGVTLDDLRAAPAARERGAGEHEVDLRDRLDERGERGLDLADAPRERAQDARDFLALGALRLSESVRLLDDGERLDEQRLPRRGAVVDDAGHGTARRGSQGEHRPARALRDEVVLEVLAKTRVARQRSQALGHPRPSAAQLATQAPERGRRAVSQIGAVVLDRTVELVAETRAALDRSRPPARVRPRTPAALSSCARAARALAIDRAIARRAPGSSTLPRAATAAAARTSATFARSGSADAS